jgi:putative oxygen-independent coproporphyrinogen III oxidase
MPSTPPPGDPVPTDGRLPESATATLGEQSFGFYLHVPYCSTRCGYCDFNTYTASELGGGASQETYAAQAVEEIRLARRVLGDRDLPVATVFVGGGTPTLLPAADLARLLDAVREEFGLADGAEVTTEANPDSVTPESLAALREAGFTRVSFGMQSASPHVLATLDRTHTPGRAVAAAAEATAAGFEHVNLDLIYGTPGESLEDWSLSLDAAIAAQPDHVSAYALIVEDGTRLAARVRRGDLPAPDDDDLADKYLLADERLGAAGLGWYEVSNWAATSDAECRHNQLYWTGADWWGVGPGAHSHVGGTRWWNVRHPVDYARRIGDGESPGQAREVLDPETRRVERVLLEIRLSSGLPLDVLDAGGRTAAAEAVATGLLEAAAFDAGRAVLTRRGRLLADAVVRSLL